MQKVKFAKMYDSLDWNFLWFSLRKRGFPFEMCLGSGDVLPLIPSQF